MVGDLAEAIKRPSTKVLLAVSPVDISRIHDDLSQRYRDRLFVTQSEDIHVELLNIKANKGAALEAVARALGVPAERSVGVGDGDIEMLRWAGLGVAVGEAKPQLKAVANLVLDESPQAVAEFIAGLRA